MYDILCITYEYDVFTILQCGVLSAVHTYIKLTITSYYGNTEYEYEYEYSMTVCM